MVSCTSSDDDLIDNPLQNTNWEKKYSGNIIFPYDISSFNDVQLGELLNTYMFTSKFGAGYVKDINNSGISSYTSGQLHFTEFINFAPSNNLMGKINVTFSDSNNSFCDQQNNINSYTIAPIKRQDYIADIPSSGLKFVFDNNQPKKLFRYRMRSTRNIGFAVYESIDNISSCPSGTTSTLPSPDFLKGTWNLDLIYSTGNELLGEIIIENFELETGSSIQYSLTGKLKEVVNGQITEYPFVSSFFDKSTKVMEIIASNGTDTFEFRGVIDQVDGKWKGFLGEDSARINHDILGDFIATKQ